jgi:thiamine-monophosphate kinase
MIDISDGLSVDLGHICDMSGLGARVNASAVPIHADARSRTDPLSAALGDGEDYELLFTLDPAEADSLLADQPLGDVIVTRIGTMVAAQQRTLVMPDGLAVELKTRGWEHGTAD